MKKSTPIITLLTAVLLFTLLIITACESVDKKDPYPPKIITSIISSEANSVEIAVKIIGNDGNIINGATVNAINPANNMIILDFNNGVYRNYFDSLISGDYVIKAIIYYRNETTLLSRTYKHEIIIDKPEINNITDGTGKSSKIGEPLNHTSPIAVNWTDIPNVIYTFSILHDNQVIYMQNEKTSSILIPANSLDPDKSYYAYIYAEYINGDPFYLKSDFLSISKRTGNLFFFRTSHEN